MMQCAAEYTSRRLSAISGLLASACACAARKWCGDNSTHSHHIVTPIIALETSSHLRNNNNGRMMQCAAEYTSRRLSAISGLLASACACAARKCCGVNSTHSHHIFTPNIALETSSHLRNNNIGRMMQCAAVYTSRRLSAMSGSTRKCMRLRGSNMVWREFYTLPPHVYAEYCPRDFLPLAKQ